MLVQDVAARDLVVQEIDFADPVEIAAALRGLPMLTFLDSAMADGALGRYGFVAADPFDRLTGRWSDPSWTARLRAALARFALPLEPGLPPFQGGAAGLFSYDLGRSLERLPAAEFDELEFPDLSIGLYDVVVAFDMILRRAFVVSTGFPETEPGARRARARSRADEILDRICGFRAPPPGLASLSGFASNFTREGYERAVAEVIERILAGDIFQANLSQRFAAPVPDGFDPFGFYRRLRAVNPAPFAAFLEHEGFAIASASPERFLRVDGSFVETRPIKGTRPRFTHDALLDMLQTKALSESRKDRAENVMIVDLLRNDLSRVCAPGSVKVPHLCAVETYASVHHLVSTVTGRLAEGFTPVDLLAAAFPGGSITGAPKLRAMEIIAELERHARGPYCGALGYLGFNGLMDLNIVIRTASFRRGLCVVQAGGGIVTASDPASEYVETLDKARRIFQAFGAREFA
ncbi:aminodeoxychorismate synthase component I [Methylocella sp.]|uniref:aminodeoxychorismate synthase component I n=1 Tax=Methylocella sp. TaxID=1978226 RepID=UPI003784B9B6